ncbi:MAG: hypothetical protein EOP55_20260 [Sphingobacteriales bacterium]|nr:MAG: hypothetical protein EOP55_20260 [Sphingobacteriales bacterium]
MQTLIATSSAGNFPMTNGNGVSKKLVDSHANGVIVAHSNRNNIGNTNSSLDNDTEVRQLGLISSTPILTWQLYGKPNLSRVLQTMSK